MKFGFNKKKFFHIIQDNNCATIHNRQIAQHICDLLYANKVRTFYNISNVRDMLDELMLKHNGVLKNYDETARLAIYIESKKDQQSFIDDLNAYYVAEKLVG